MLNKDVEIKSIFSEIIKSLEQYRQLIFYELIEIICPQIVGFLITCYTSIVIWYMKITIPN